MTIAVSTTTPFSVFDAIPDNLKIGAGGATGIGGGARRDGFIAVLLVIANRRRVRAP